MDLDVCPLNSIIQSMANPGRLIAPSILAADFSNISDEISIAAESGADWIHLDIMDGSFVPPISFGTQMVATVRQLTNLPLDAHLMIVNPRLHVKSFIDVGVDRLTFHIESEIHAHRLVSIIRDAGVVPGISLNPATPISSIIELLEFVDQVLVMSVNPGYSGQKLIPSTLNKVRTLVELRNKGAGEYLIVVDGGFCESTASDVWGAGVDVAVMGSAFFDNANPKASMHTCRNANWTSKE